MSAESTRSATLPTGSPGRDGAVRIQGTATPAVAATGLASGYSGRRVWSGADFSVREGEFLTVLGPNGAGKSTLLRMLLGLLAPAAGELRVFGEHPRRGNPRIGYVPQRRTLDPDLGVGAAELVGLGVDGHRWGLRLSPRKAKQRKAEVARALAAVGASGYAERSVGRLSGGEQQRLLLAQALVTQPDLLLLDEPLASLDLRSQLVVSQLVARLRREYGFTVVLVTHDVNPVLEHTDHVMYVAAGQVSVGTPQQVITSANLSRLYRTEVEVLTDRHGRVVVVGVDADTSHHTATSQEDQAR